jgi:circadian clock protein KaiC
MAGASHARLSVGIPGLDSMLQGGLLRGSTTLALGPAGSGKTLLGLHFLTAGARNGEPGLHFGFYETPARLASKASNIGLNLDQHLDRGVIEIV